jgi:flavin-dependent dehydrogenase
MSSGNTYDVIIVGGGLAGLSLAILLSRKQRRVLVLEKESYPKHKVCGEYISMESKPFLQSLGLPIDEMQLPVINQLQVTDTRGNEVNAHLPQGGFGISRHALDAALAALAQQAGAALLTKTRADDIQYAGDSFTVHTKSQVFQSQVVCGTWGKRSNIDVKMQRSFMQEKNKALSNYIGIKYHVRYAWPVDTIGLHNFTDGYCGVSSVEDGQVCVCYLTTAANLQKNNNDIKKMERDVLMKNPWLDKIFSKAEFLYDHPLAISQISFQKKEQVLDHVLLLGDAAGMITPLCGNGMSMALHAAKMAGVLVDEFLGGSITRINMEKNYIANWNNIFSTRLTLGRLVQSSFGKDRTTSFLLKAANHLPFIRKALINGTSGKPF